VEYFHPLPKRYVATLRLGVRTNTDDATGERLASSERWRSVTVRGFEEALAGFLGEIDQVPPQFSARKVHGRRAYAAARAGETVALAARRTRVHELSVIDFHPPEVRLRCVVSTGTYIRALARDLGEILKCGGHLTALRRTSIGPFEVERASAPEEWVGGEGVPESAWVPAAEMLNWLPTRRLNRAEAERIGQGGSVPLGDVLPPEAGSPEFMADGEGAAPVCLLWEGGVLAVAERGGDALHPRKVFRAE